LEYKVPGINQSLGLTQHFCMSLLNTIGSIL